MSRAPVVAVLAGIAGLAFAAVSLMVWRHYAGPVDSGVVTVKLRLAGEPEAVQLRRGAEGRLQYELQRDGARISLTPDELAERLYAADRQRDWWATLLNVTSPVGLLWIALGLGGQALFTGRMLVQWWASERAGRSHVPEAFWWMSLGGSSLLLVYFLWRVDVVGVLGQLTGWWVYVRNLMLIQRMRGAGTGSPRP